MKVVEFTTETISLLPEWDIFPALIEPLQLCQPGSGPSYCSRFTVKLRLQRKERYYVTQIFMITILITMASCLPLCFPPTGDFVGDRLALHASGLLTLVAFKYSMSQDLPPVPYHTFVNGYLTRQMVTLVAVMVECVIMYKVVSDHEKPRKDLENTIN